MALYFAYGTTRAGFPHHRRLAALLGEPVARCRTALPHAVVVPRAAACSNPGCELVHRMAVLVGGFAPLRAEGDLFGLGADALPGYPPELAGEQAFKPCCVRNPGHPPPHDVVDPLA